MQPCIAKVAIDKAAYGFDKTYDYAVGPEWTDIVQPGCRVTVSFGRGGNKRIGLIMSLSSHCENKSVKLKPIEAVLDQAPLLNHEMLELVWWLKERTFCTLFEAAKALLPTGVNHKMVVSYMAEELPRAEQIDALPEAEKQILNYLQSKTGYIKRENLLKTLGFDEQTDILERMYKKGLLARNMDAIRRVSDQTVRMLRLAGDEAEEALPKLTAKQNAVLDVLNDVGTASVKEICYFTGVTPAVTAALERKGLLVSFEVPVFRDPSAGKIGQVKQAPIVLTDEQQKAFDNLMRQLDEDKGSASLLYGVTGSGKTQVYLRMIDEVIARNRGVIVMVPEIALTPQTLALFRERYGDKVAIFHSALSVGERADEWKRVKQGDARIAVGTRSAVFAPFEDLGLIIIDEEQEHTYKSEQSPRYNTKEVAIFRCSRHRALLLLSSATPSVTTYSSALSGRYSLNVLKNRYGPAILPEVITVDMRQELQQGNTSAISKTLLQYLEATLAEKRQSILLINRRGYNTFAVCRACSEVITCSSCSISMTYHHANQRLMCHYCGFSQPFTDVCGSCGKKDVRYSGFGTQKIEDEIAALMPTARVLRMDTDTTMSRLSHETKFEQFSAREYDILLGTQMVAKGLDFENVTLVGVVSVDQQLYNDDYRSMENAFALLTQVVGRSGRGRYKGNAIIQTLTPENEIIRLAAAQDYESFYKTEIRIRQMLTYPPFCDLCLFGFSGDDEARVRDAAKYLLEQIRTLTATEYADQKLIVLGPMPARVKKVSNKYRYRLIIKCRNSSSFRRMVDELLSDFARSKEFGAVCIFVDINPETML